MNKISRRLAEFDNIKRIDLDGNNYWMLSELSPLLGYSTKDIKYAYRKAVLNCRLNENDINEHFYKLTRIIDTDTTSIRKKDYMLTRYACALLLNNCDGRKDGVTLGKVYFANNPGKQDIDRAVAQYDETFKRLLIRNEIRQWNRRLAAAARKAGVTKRDQHAVFQNAGYLGLYRMTAEDLRKKRMLENGAVIPEYMSSMELGINLFRITQTVELLKQSPISETADAMDIHYKVGKEIRACLKRIGGVMPEDYPIAAVKASQLEREQLAITRHNNLFKVTDYDTEADGNYWEDQIS
ncbi:MAG: DNA damage-inducible protein D [Peptococcaceae bacterium]|nr:DNA damage-inducible protein D [Peptococcaceae bacterium]